MAIDLRFGGCPATAQAIASHSVRWGFRIHGGFLQRILPAAIVVAMLLTGLVGWAIDPGAASGARQNCDTPDADNSTAELQLLTLLNSERSKSGIPALQVSPGLNRAAAWKSRDSSASGPGFSHTDSLGRSVNQRATDCEYARSMGENIAYGFPSAQTVFSAWMASAGHKSNMLNGAWQFAGIGEYQGRWTLDLGTVNDTSGSSPTATPTQSAPNTNTPTPRPTATPTASPPSAAAAGIQQNLSAGFNLVTFAGTEQAPESVVRSLAPALVAVYEWDAASGRWLRHIANAPGYVNSLRNLRPGTAYFVVLSSDATWVY